METDNLDSSEKLIDDEIGIKNYIIDFIKRRVTKQLFFESLDSFLKVIEINETIDESRIPFDGIDKDELIIIESRTRGNWIIITTKRIIIFYENKLTIERIEELLDFTDNLVDCDWYGEEKEYEILEIETLRNEIIEFEVKTGVSLLIVINCMQRLFRLYGRNRNKKINVA